MITTEQAQKLAERNANIPTEQVERDIADTEAEIVQMKREVEGFRLIGDRMSLLRAGARVDGIREREEFIEKLQAILSVRRAGTTCENS